MPSLWVWPFELEEKIGEGGMGVVYRGRYVKNDRRVAVKLLPQDVADETILARFGREVELLKSLRHPNIVHSFGGVCEDKRRFYAMELVEGGSLDDLLRSRGGRLPWEQAVELGVQMCAALQHAHERGVIHRDVKPGNFLLTRQGKLKLSDFGLATVTAGHKLTDGGKTVGSFRYMAPEQVRGKPAPVPQTDLYALGCVLYQMVTGRPPFDGTTAAELLNKHLSEFPTRVAEIVPDCPAALERLIHSLLSKSIEDRPASAAEVSRELESVSFTVVAATDLTKPGIPVRREPVTTARSGSDGSAGRIAAPGFPWLTLTLFCVACILGGATYSLWQKNQQAGRAEELWAEAFHSDNAELRNQGADALGELGVHSKPAVDVLEADLQSEDPARRAAAISGLGKAGANARHLSTRLLSIHRNDDSPMVRAAAGEARRRIVEAEEKRGVPWFWMLTAIVVLAGSGAGIWFVRRYRTDAIG